MTQAEISFRAARGAAARFRQRELFFPSPISIAVNPIYISRKGLVDNVRQLAPGITGDVLDFGCGSKPYEELFTGARSYVGVDIAVSGHDHGDSRIDYFYDGKVLPFADDSFDAVVAFEVFEHVFNIDEVLAEIGRVLKPGGKLLLSIPFAWEEHEQPYDFARYTSFGIRHVLDKAGYETMEQRKTSSYLLAVAQVVIVCTLRHLAPRQGLWRKFVQLTMICPMTLLALGANALLPKRDEYFGNQMIVARNRKGA